MIQQSSPGVQSIGKEKESGLIILAKLWLFSWAYEEREKRLKSSSIKNSWYDLTIGMIIE
ncbi:MAG: hypothetical protein MRY79_03490 [Alphaproteobacteria bacterium]|nr:hypothetical protein [Alphaproteobacteria bacterium]